MRRVARILLVSSVSIVLACDMIACISYVHKTCMYYDHNTKTIIYACTMIIVHVCTMNISTSRIVVIVYDPNISYDHVMCRHSRSRHIHYHHRLRACTMITVRAYTMIKTACMHTCHTTVLYCMQNTQCAAGNGCMYVQDSSNIFYYDDNTCMYPDHNTFM